MACDSVKLLTMHSSCTHRMHPKSGNFNSKLQKNSSIPHSVIISAFRRAILLKHQNAEKDLIVSVLKRMVFDELIENALKPLTLVQILNLNEETISQVLKTSNFVEDVSKKMFESLRDLQDNGFSRADARSTNFKYIDDGAPYASFGNQNCFHEGLDSIIGHPELHVLRAIIREHDDNQHFLTKNYSLYTSPMTEISFLLGSDTCHEYLRKVAENNGKKVSVCLAPSEQEVAALRPKIEFLNNHFLKIKRGCFPGEVGTTYSDVKVTLEITCQNYAGAEPIDLISKKMIDENLIDIFFSCRSNIQEDMLELKERLSRLVPDFLYSNEGMNKVLMESVLPLSYQDFEFQKDWFLEAVTKSLLKEVELGSANLKVCVDMVDARTWNYTKEGKEKMSKIGRVSKSLEDLMNLDDVRKANLRVEEATAAYMYTGPMYQVIYSTWVRQYQHVNLMRNLAEVECCSSRSCFKWAVQQHVCDLNTHACQRHNTASANSKGPLEPQGVPRFGRLRP